MTHEEMINEWRNGNNAGRGYPIGREDDSLEDAADSAGWDVIDTVYPEGHLICDTGAGTVLLCDHNGPWVVDVVTEGDDD